MRSGADWMFSVVVVCLMQYYYLVWFLLHVWCLLLISPGSETNQSAAFAFLRPYMIVGSKKNDDFRFRVISTFKWAAQYSLIFLHWAGSWPNFVLLWAWPNKIQFKPISQSNSLKAQKIHSDMGQFNQNAAERKTARPIPIDKLSYSLIALIIAVLHMLNIRSTRVPARIRLGPYLGILTTVSPSQNTFFNMPTFLNLVN